MDTLSHLQPRGKTDTDKLPMCLRLMRRRPSQLAKLLA